MSVSQVILSPPIAFVIFLIAGYSIIQIASRWSPKGSDSPDRSDQYACGQPISARRLQPDYSGFFRFALFFTIMHVMVLVAATVPSGRFPFLALIYLAGGGISAWMLLGEGADEDE